MNHQRTIIIQSIHKSRNTFVEIAILELQRKIFDPPYYPSYGPNFRDWHHGGQSGVMLCGDCRVYYKKYGFDKVILDRPPTPPELVRLREEQNQKATVEDDVSYHQKKTYSCNHIKSHASQKDIKLQI